MRYDHICHWLFDLDNTLYSPAAALFGQIDERMGQYIGRLLSVGPEEARRIQKAFFHEHGTTLRGLMNDHGVEPAHFLEFVHDIDLSVLARDERLLANIEALPGRKLIFTNADTPYARNVLDRLGILGAFEDIICIRCMAYWPKPDARAYEILTRDYAVEPEAALFVEDTARNLKPAKAMGMTTIWVDNGSERGNHDAHPSYIDLTIRHVGEWLDEVVAGLKEAA
ncbi:MAG: pyrimidine 5'-nucleotidase [Sphingomonadaceae bacterium]|nr:pyrimidine 5'-nucleotidase [Sphingomonadaceae bacterium]